MNTDRTCLNCRHWSDLIARKPPGSWQVEALCLQPKSPHYCGYVTGDRACVHFDAGLPVDMHGDHLRRPAPPVDMHGHHLHRPTPTQEIPAMKQPRDFLTHPGSYNAANDSRSVADHANPFEDHLRESSHANYAIAGVIVICLAGWLAFKWFA